MIKIYEVMAIENDFPLFFLQHINRLQRSISKYADYNTDFLIDSAKNLIKPLLNGSNGKNVKLSYTVENNIFEAEIVMSRRPAPILYKNGGTVGILNAERDNPLIKKENLSLRTKSEEICSLHGYYDLLLLNNRGEITEGSRSNFLCIDNLGNIVTSPIGDSLNGITREIIFEICKSNNINIIEEVITVESLKKYKSLLITGTSPGILPIIKCEDIKFSISNSIIDTLVADFEKRKVEDRLLTQDIFL